MAEHNELEGEVLLGLRDRHRGRGPRPSRSRRPARPASPRHRLRSRGRHLRARPHLPGGGGRRRRLVAGDARAGHPAGIRPSGWTVVCAPSSPSSPTASRTSSPADVIWASMSLHHVGDEVAALARAGRSPRAGRAARHRRARRPDAGAARRPRRRPTGLGRTPRRGRRRVVRGDARRAAGVGTLRGPVHDGAGRRARGRHRPPRHQALRPAPPRPTPASSR